MINWLFKSNSIDPTFTIYNSGSSLLLIDPIQMVFVWCQSFLRYDNVNIWRKWPWRSRSIDPIFDRVLKGPKIHILWENEDSRSWRFIAQTSSSYRRTDGRTDRRTDGANDNTPSANCRGVIKPYLAGHMEILPMSSFRRRYIYLYICMLATPHMVSTWHSTLYDATKPVCNSITLPCSHMVPSH